MGGLTPLYEPLPGLYSPPKRPCVSLDLHESHTLWGQAQEGQTLRGVFPGVVPPQMAPLILGLLGSCWGVLLVAIVPSFTDFSDFLGRLFLVNSRVCIHS